jgi:peptidoglycan/xylan/chitin deacetylase (PgdA/CDA1 family)
VTARGAGRGLRRSLKAAVLHLCRGLGLFALAERSTARGLRILCYHGVSVSDESAWRPRMFMEVATFRARLDYLVRKRVPVLRLDEALARLQHGDLPPRATVITADDGYWTFCARALPLLRARGFPVTLYVMSEWAVSGEPVFDLAVEYLLWKTRQPWLDLAALGVRGGAVPLSTCEARRHAARRVVEHGEGLDDAGRVALATALGDALGVDYRALRAGRALGLVGRDEIAGMTAAGVDVQLHTHRHCFPEEESTALREIADNRAALEPVVGRPLRHFCYPRGQWSRRHWPWLRAAGIASATTCDPGLNARTTPPLALRRFLDGEDVSAIEFEAEVTGFAEFPRALRARLLGALGR